MEKGGGDVLFKRLILEQLAGLATATHTDWVRGRTYWEQALQLAVQYGDEETRMRLVGQHLCAAAFHLGEIGAARDIWEKAVERPRVRSCLRRSGAL